MTRTQTHTAFVDSLWEFICWIHHQYPIPPVYNFIELPGWERGGRGEGGGVLSIVRLRTPHVSHSPNINDSYIRIEVSSHVPLLIQSISVVGSLIRPTNKKNQQNDQTKTKQNCVTFRRIQFKFNVVCGNVWMNIVNNRQKLNRTQLILFLKADLK